MFDKTDRHALFHELHRTIEESATHAVRKLMEGVPELTYPPNNGFESDELQALESLPRTSALESALRKIVADAAASPLFHLMSLADGVADFPELKDIRKGDQLAVEIMLHDGFYESYWAWRRRRPDPGWKLDNWEDE